MIRSPAYVKEKLLKMHLGTATDINGYAVIYDEHGYYYAGSEITQDIDVAVMALCKAIANQSE